MAGFVVPFVFFAGIVGLIWAIYNYKKLSDVNVKPMEEGEEESGKEKTGGTEDDGTFKEKKSRFDIKSIQKNIGDIKARFGL